MSHFKSAARTLLKSPGYTALAVGALALGIGANAVLFSAINTLFLRPLALPEPDRLVRVYSSYPDRGMEQVPLSWPRFASIREQQSQFAAVAATSFTGFTLTGHGEPEQLQARRVSGHFFQVLGVQPVVGRAFAADEDAPGGPDVVLLSHAFWQKHFGGRPDIVGQVVTLDGRPRTIVGAMPPLPFPFDQPQVWAPRAFEQEGIPPDLRDRGTGYLEVYARLKPGVSLAQAAEHLRVLVGRYGAADPARVDAKAGQHLVSLHEDIVGQQRPMFLTLLAAVGCVLLVACANVANLLLARFTARRKEIAIRAALGATRGRVVTLFLTESVLTAALAGALGVLLAVWGVNLLGRVGEEFIPRVHELSLDGTVIAFALGLTLLTGLALGVVPALQASRTDAAEALKDSTRGSSAGRHAGRFRAALLVGEVALSLVLLVGAALLVDSFRRLQQVDAGFRSQDITTFFVGLPPGQYPDETRQARFFQAALEKIATLPGVTHVSAASALPVVGGASRSPAAAEGGSLPPVHERTMARRSTATPGFLAALDIPLKRGRDFTWRDQPGAPDVVLINELLAQRLFPNQDPIGRRIVTGIQSIPREVVGVFASVRSENLAQPPIEEMIYPAMQLDGAFLNVVLRSTRPSASLRAELAHALHAVDAGLPLGEVQPFAGQLAGALADRMLAMNLLAGFAALALVLAGLGIYSVIAYSVAQRTNEFGIRMALGADRGAVVRLVMREGLRLAGVGLLIGLALSVATTRLMQNLLFEVSASDPLILGGVAAFLCAVAALACWIPARRATKVDPMVALRSE